MNELKEWWPRNGDTREEGEDDEDNVWLGKEKKKPRVLVLLVFMMFCGSSNKLTPWFIVPISLFLSRKSLKETQKFEGDEIVCVWERRGIFLVWWIFGSILGCDKPIHPCVCFDKYINVGKRKLQVGPIDLALFKIYIFWFPLFVIKNFNTDLDYPWFHIVNSIFLCVYDALSILSVAISEQPKNYYKFVYSVPFFLNCI